MHSQRLRSLKRNKAQDIPDTPIEPFGQDPGTSAEAGSTPEPKRRLHWKLLGSKLTFESDLDW